MPPSPSPEDSHFVWSYAVEISNDGQETVQLKSRMWRITDALGHEDVAMPATPQAVWKAAQKAVQRAAAE